MLLYFLKTIILLGIFYMVYTICLRPQKAFRWNRMYLLLTAIIVIISPAIFFNNLQKQMIIKPIVNNGIYEKTIDTVSIYRDTIQHTEINFLHLIFILFFAGILWGLLRIVFGFYIIYKLKKISTIEKLGSHTVYFNSQIETPFSFFSYIFIPEAFRNKEILNTILEHEKAHIHLNHSYDKLFFSILQTFYWFNPFIYLYHKEMELQHEFEADAFSTKQIETDHYVKNLLETITYNQTPTLLVHQFFHHPLKNRITMLYKNSKNILVEKTIVIISTALLLSFTLILQSRAQTKQEPQPKEILIQNPDHPGETVQISKLSRTPDSLLDKSTVDQLPEFVGGEQALQDYFNRMKGSFSDDEKPQKEIQVQLQISSNGAVVTVGADPFLDEKIKKDIARVFKNMPAWNPGIKNGKAVPVITYASVRY